ncbi:MAG: sensor histidine kinase [Candidatus Xenobia bacterium]
MPWLRCRLNSMRWRLIVGSLLWIGLPLIAVALITAGFLWHFYLQVLRDDLQVRAAIISDVVAYPLRPDTPDDPALMARLVEHWHNLAGTRVTIIDMKGIVQGCTNTDEIDKPVNPTEKPGMLEALRSGQVNSTIWRSPEYAFAETMYVNLPVFEGSQVIGVVRTAYRLSEIRDLVYSIRGRLLIALGLYAFVTMLCMIFVADRIVRPVEALTAGARRLAEGDLSHQLPVSGTDEVQDLSRTLNEMTQRLNQLESLRRQYVSDVSHELRTPLGSIRGMAETILRHGGDDPGVVHRYAERILGQTDRLTRLVNHLLDLAALESGRAIDTFGPVSIVDTIQSVVASLTPGVQQARVELKVDLPPSLQPARANADRLTQVFVNLLDNAIRSTPPGGQIRVDAQAAEDHVTIAVSDTGCGIPSNDLPHIFDRFYRVEKSRAERTGGRGLGLSIVRQIVLTHHGEIRVESEADHGTRFYVTLPVWKGDSSWQPS